MKIALSETSSQTVLCYAKVLWRTPRNRKEIALLVWVAQNLFKPPILKQGFSDFFFIFEHTAWATAALTFGELLH